MDRHRLYARRWSSSHGLSSWVSGGCDLCLASLPCFDHIALIATLCAGARIDILEALKLEELALLAKLTLHLVFDRCVGVHLSIG